MAIVAVFPFPPPSTETLSFSLSRSLGYHHRARTGSSPRPPSPPPETSLIVSRVPPVLSSSSPADRYLGHSSVLGLELTFCRSQVRLLHRTKVSGMRVASMLEANGRGTSAIPSSRPGDALLPVSRIGGTCRPQSHIGREHNRGSAATSRLNGPPLSWRRLAQTRPSCFARRK